MINLKKKEFTKVLKFMNQYMTIIKFINMRIILKNIKKLESKYLNNNFKLNRRIQNR